ncbi:hypothetical protein AAHA92_22444 [Salvia divinorum]|uniref:DUF668 domain-containing protein n=1 Tax=Salvia divinorum TaxID=28513 RepID=A0ABD1GNQ0_SALDI
MSFGLGVLRSSSRREPIVGILAFDVSRMMSKVVKIWNSVSARQIARLKVEISNSIGIHRLVSADDNYVLDLAIAEIIDNLMDLGKSVAILGNKCADSTYHNLEPIFNDPSAIDPKWYGWQYRLKKMERKVKKMDKFVAATEQLHTELQELVDYEQSLKRMRAGANFGKMKLIECQHKVLWQRQEVKTLQEMSPWVRTYDYVVRLLLRSLFTIIERIKYALGSSQIGDGNEWFPSPCNSMSGLEQSNDHGACMRRTCSYSASRACKNKMKGMSSYDRSPSSIRCGMQQQMIGGFTGCMTGGGIESPVLETYYGSSEKDGNEIEEACTTIPGRRLSTILSSERSFFLSKRGLLNAPPSTLGYAALALHYACVIVLMEKLASSPQLISLDARDDLYDMLPLSIRSRLRVKLKAFSSTLDPFEYNAAELSSEIAGILEWLSPLARNMIRWQSERNFERERVVCGSNILLVQTLHFANQADTEAAITELLMRLSYLFQFGKNTNFREPSCSRAFDGYFFPRYNSYYDYDYDTIDHIQ